MKKVRFTTLVQSSGRPEIYLLLTRPQEDRDFQRALMARRILTLHRGGGQADFATAGYDAKAGGQILLFPRPLKVPDGARVVGIDYDLFKEEAAAPAKKVASKPEPKARAVERKSRPVAKRTQAKEEAPAPEKVIPFTPPPSAHDEEEEDETVAELRAGIRRALKALEGGKQVAAYNILKRLAE